MGTENSTLLCIWSPAIIVNVYKIAISENKIAIIDSAFMFLLLVYIYICLVSPRC